MPRNVDSATAGQLKEDKSFVLMARMDFPDVPVYVHSRYGDIDYDGNTYSGIGHYGTIETIGEDTDINPQRVKLKLSDIEGYFNSKVIQDSLSYQNRDVYIYLNLMDETRQLITGGVAFRFISGNFEFNEGQESTISMELTNQFANWKRASSLRYTDTMQQELYAGDTGLQYVQNTLKDKVWRAFVE